MRYTKLIVLVPCAMLFGLMALGASAAQAEPGNAWVILDANGVKYLVTSSLLPALKSEPENESEILEANSFEGSVHVEVRCTGSELVGIHLGEEGKLNEGGKVLLTGCTVWINGEAVEECKVHSAGNPVGTVSTNSLKGLLKLHNNELVLLLAPTKGTELIRYLMGSECVLGEELPVLGYVVDKDCEEFIETHLVKHLLEEDASLTLIGVLDDPSAQILGSRLVSLRGQHLALRWGAEMFR
jgi:hypothetical protein